AFSALRFIGFPLSWSGCQGGTPPAAAPGCLLFCNGLGRLSSGLGRPPPPGGPCRRPKSTKFHRKSQFRIEVLASCVKIKGKERVVSNTMRHHTGTTSEVIKMADMFAPLVEQLKANPKTIVFTEGSDPRILEAASKLLAGQILKVVMVGNKAECEAAAAAGGFDISGAEIIDPDTYEGFDEMVNTMVELRKGKMTAEECRDLLKKSNYFGTMLVKMGKADCLLSGATYSTADTVRPALQLIKTKKGAHLVSSCFIL